MSKTIITDWYFWMASIAFGACMAFAYDFLRLFRRIIKHGRIAVDLEDILYWTVCFFVSFVLLYYGNNGVIRFAAVFGAAVGMLIYAFTVGRIFVKFSYFIIDKTIGSLFRKISKIAKSLHKSVAYANYKITKFFQKSHKNKIFRKFRLTRNIINHKIKIQHNFERQDSATRNLAISNAADRVKEGTEYGSSKNCKKKKNAGISTRQK